MDPVDLIRLVRQGRESLDVELKRWFDPADAPGIAKIAKACMALRNNNGGFLIIGIDGDGNYDSVNAPPDVKTIFSTDAIQRIVTRFSSEPFSIEIHYLRDGADTVVAIQVPSGFTSVVACKSELASADGGKLLSCDDVYVRTVLSNHTVSSARAGRGDWDRVIGLCFDNREADVAKFVRRHLGQLLTPEHIQALVHSPVISALGQSSADRMRSLLDKGRARLDRYFGDVHRRARLDVGTLEFCVEVCGRAAGRFALTPSNLRAIDIATPQLTGWTPWVVLSGARAAGEPVVLDDGWETLLDERKNDGFGPSFDFWRIEPSGWMYHLRGLEDDFRNPKERVLDPILQISRIAEAVVIAREIARTVGFITDQSTVNFGVRWRGLAGRALYTWSYPRRMFRSVALSTQDEVLARTEFSLDIPDGNIGQVVAMLVEQLFSVFSSEVPDINVVNGIVAERLAGK
jgi:hypothetical protein